MIGAAHQPRLTEQDIPAATNAVPFGIRPTATPGQLHLATSWVNSDTTRLRNHARSTGTRHSKLAWEGKHNSDVNIRGKCFRPFGMFLLHNLCNDMLSKRTSYEANTRLAQQATNHLLSIHMLLPWPKADRPIAIPLLLPISSYSCPAASINHSMLRIYAVWVYGHITLPASAPEHDWALGARSSSRSG